MFSGYKIFMNIFFHKIYNTSLDIIGKEACVILWKSVSNFNSASKRVQYLQAKLLPHFKLAYEFDRNVQSKLLP